MLCQLAGTAAVIFAVLLVAEAVVAFDVQAVIRKTDANKRSAIVFANGKERTTSISSEVRVLDKTGKNISGGPTAKELKEGAAVILSVERAGNTMQIGSIRLGGNVNSPNTTGRTSIGRSSVGFTPPHRV